METKEIINWIKKWNPYCESVTLSTIFSKMKFGRGNTHVINHGPPGTGKSRSSLELIQEINLGNDIIIDNTTTDRGLFETFQEYNKSDIILDECSTLLRSAKTQDMVKSAMEGKPLTWTKNGESETTEPYKGNMIINSNVSIAEPVIDRCLVNKTLMNREMTLNFNELFIEQSKNKQNNFDHFIKFLRTILNDEKEIILNDKEIEDILNFTQENIKDLDKESGFSRRIIIRELNYFKHVKKLFGSLNKEVLEFVKPFAAVYIINTQTPGLIQNIVGNGNIEKPALVKKIAKEGGYSEQHARKIINKEIEDGKLILKGKLIKLKK